MDLAGLGKLINLESVTMLCYSCCNCCNSITLQSPTLGTWLYRVAHLLANLGWVDHDLNCSTLWLVMPRLMGNGRSGWARWWNIPKQSLPNPGSSGDGPPAPHPVMDLIERGSHMRHVSSHKGIQSYCIWWAKLQGRLHWLGVGIPKKKMNVRLLS